MDASGPNPFSASSSPLTSSQQTPTPSSSRPPRPPKPHNPLTSSRFAPATNALAPHIVPRRPRSRSTKDPYIPPHRARRLAAAVPLPILPASKSGQSRAWTNMKKRINRIVNMINSDNVALCAKALFRLNLIRARGIFVKTILRHQLASPSLSPVFACLIAIIGSRLPQVAELLVARLIAQLKAAYANQDRVLCFATAKFIAHLFNQQVVTDLLLLQFLTTCTLDPSDGSIELAIITLQECTVLLTEKCPRPLEFIFQRLRQVLHDGDLSKRVQVMIEDLITMRRKTITNDTVLDPRLDLLDDEDIITHSASLDDDDENSESNQVDLQYESDKFQYDPDYEENERIYEEIKRDILGAEADAPESLFLISSTSSGGNSSTTATKDKDTESDGHSSDIVATTPSSNGTGKIETTPESKDSRSGYIKDMTETDTLEFRRTVYLTIASGLSSEEWAHKLMILMRKNSGREYELCEIVIECCSQEKTFLRPFGLLGQRLCLIDSMYTSKFEELFARHYGAIHEFNTRKIRNMACFYAFLFATDALPWSTFLVVRIVQKETTSSSRIFLKNLFQEMAKTLGKSKITEKFADHIVRGNLDGLLPTNNVENAKFAIRFFQAIELEYLAEGLHGKLATLPTADGDDGSDGDMSSSISSSSLSSSSSSSESECSGGNSSVRGTDHQHPLSENISKRGQEESSLEPSVRPTKSRRDNDGNIVSIDDKDSVGEKRAGSNDRIRRKGDNLYSDDRYGYDSDSKRSDGSKRDDQKRGYRGVGNAGHMSDGHSDADIDQERRRLRMKERRRARGSSGGYSSSENEGNYEQYETGRRIRMGDGERSRRGGHDDEDKYDERLGGNGAGESGNGSRQRERTRRYDRQEHRDTDGSRNRYFDSDREDRDRERDRDSGRKFERRSRGRRHSGSDNDEYMGRREVSRREGRRSRKDYTKSPRLGGGGSSDSDDGPSLGCRSRSRSPQRRSKYWSGVDRYGRSTEREYMEREEDRRKR